MLSTGTEMPSGKLAVDVEYKAKPSVPLRPSPSEEGTIGTDILPPIYAHEQHSTWARLYRKQDALLQGRVCKEYLEGRQKLSLPAEHVPHLAYASMMLERQTGWKICRVNGFVPAATFFQILANRCFPCTDFVRHPDELEYTPAPDMFHDLMGHLPMITNPRFAQFFHDYGLAGSRAQSQSIVDELGRIYWFTVEFGLINPTAHDGPQRNPQLSRVYGAGISSSFGEIVHSLEKAEKIPFNITEIAAREFDIHEMQPSVYEISSFDELESEFHGWARAKKLL